MSDTPILPPPSSAGPRWEYFVASFRSGTDWAEIQAWLNAAGYDGWELVNADIERNLRIVGAPASVTCFLKRPWAT